MQPDRFTIKSQEAVQAALQLADDRRNPAGHARAPAARGPAGAGAGSSSRCSRRSAPTPAAIRAELDARARRAADARRAAARPPAPRPSSCRSCARPSTEMREAQGRVRLDRAPAARARGPQLDGRRRAARRRRHAATRCCRRSPRSAARTASPTRARGQVPGAGEVRPRPHRGSPRRQARPGHRPRRRDPPRHPGPLAPHEEQPRAHRRARRRQDRHRRGPRPAHRLAATSPSRCATAASSRSTSAR